MDWLDWTVVNILVPGLAPIGGVFVLWLVSFGEKQITVHPATVLKDGQIGWVTIAFCASAIYEMREFKHPLPILKDLLGAAIFVAALWVAWGAAAPTPFPDTPKGGFKLLFWSFGLAIVAATTFLCIHFRHDWFGITNY